MSELPGGVKETSHTAKYYLTPSVSPKPQSIRVPLVIIL